MMNVGAGQMGRQRRAPGQARAGRGRWGCEALQLLLHRRQIGLGLLLKQPPLLRGPLLGARAKAPAPELGQLVAQLVDLGLAPDQLPLLLAEALRLLSDLAGQRLHLLAQGGGIQVFQGRQRGHGARSCHRPGSGATGKSGLPSHHPDDPSIP